MVTCKYIKESKMKEAERKEQLANLSKKYQCHYFQNYVFHCLLSGDIRMAQICLLGTIDGLYERGKILEVDAKIANDIIGFSLEEASVVRQKPIKL